MAKKIQATMMEALGDYMSQKDIDQGTLIKVLEESLRSAIAKMYGTDNNFDVIINPEEGDVEIWRNRIIVPDGEVTDKMKEVSVSEVRSQGEEDLEEGEEYTDKVSFESFGRRAIQNLRQSLASKVLELEKDTLYANYSKRVGELITAEVYQTWKRELLLLDGDGNELIMPRSLMIPRDRFQKGDHVTACIERVDYNNNNPKIILSRTSNDFLARLFAREVPEIQDGLVMIKRVARIPGDRAKVAVESVDTRIDPVGAVVGVRGSRIRGVVSELRNESIDVLQYTDNDQLLIQRALSPAQNADVRINPEEKHADVYLAQEEIRNAVGRSGFNIKLAMMLTGYEIDIYRDETQGLDEEDLFLSEFDDEIDPWIIDLLVSIGCDTAKSVLRHSREDLIRATDLEEKTIDYILQVLMAEFDDSELPEDEFPDLPERDPRFRQLPMEPQPEAAETLSSTPESEDEESTTEE
ncbi:transcription termination factor NusA [Porphyromonas bennonis]|uniref:transcription termination factor NusA n=1 Tax=Porphyromonas bennonis TaxID=501496 RepID=UPI0003AAEFBB|nr:transcription termination factor NusA [Porphyromonas bennonis]